MHGSCRQLHQHHHRSSKGNPQALIHKYQSGGLRHEVLGDPTLTPERIVRWKASCTWAGAWMSLAMVKAHYENANIDTGTTGLPDVDDDSQKIKHGAIWSSLAGYDTRVAKLVDANMF